MLYTNLIIWFVCLSFFCKCYHVLLSSFPITSKTLITSKILPIALILTNEDDRKLRRLEGTKVSAKITSFIHYLICFYFIIWYKNLSNYFDVDIHGLPTLFMRRTCIYIILCFITWYHYITQANNLLIYFWLAFGKLRTLKLKKSSIKRWFVKNSQSKFNTFSLIKAHWKILVCTYRPII